MSLPTSGLPTAYIERRLTRALWKLVQGVDEAVYVVPTRRLITLLMIFGRIGYPRELIELTLRAAISGQSAANRSPYEIPTSMLVSFYPMLVERTWLILDWFFEKSLILPYEDQVVDDMSDLLALATMTRDQLKTMLGEVLVEDLDTIDRWRGDLDGIRNKAALGDQPFLGAVLRAARSGDAYPALIFPKVTMAWLSQTNPTILPIVTLEQALLDRLPDRLISFNDLAVLVAHPAVKALRTAIASHLERPDGSRQSDLDTALEAALSVVAGLGFSYIDAVLGDCNFAALIPPFFEEVAESVPASATLEYLNDLAVAISHRANFALSYARHPRVEMRLLHIYGPELWLDSLNRDDMIDLFENPIRLVIDETPRTCRPF